MAYERESLIEKHLVAEVKKAGGVAFKFVSPGHRSVPDRIVLLPGGRIVFVECKSPGKPPRPDQLREHERLRKLGFTVVVLDSKNLEGILWENHSERFFLSLEAFKKHTFRCCVSFMLTGINFPSIPSTLINSELFFLQFPKTNFPL